MSKRTTERTRPQADETPSAPVRPTAPRRESYAPQPKSGLYVRENGVTRLVETERGVKQEPPAL